MERLTGAPAGRASAGRRRVLLDVLLAAWVLLVFGLYAWRFARDWLAANLYRVSGLF